MKVLPTAFLDKNVGKVRYLPEKVIKSCGSDCKVREALEMDLMTFANKTGLDINSAIKARGQLLGLKLNIRDEEPQPRKNVRESTKKSRGTGEVSYSSISGFIVAIQSKMDMNLLQLELIDLLLFYSDI
jgi:hypothetical protein